MQTNKLLFACLLSVFMFATSCFSMETIINDDSKKDDSKQEDLDKALRQAEQPQEDMNYTFIRMNLQGDALRAAKLQACLNEALRQAVINRKAQLVIALIERGADVNCQTLYGKSTPLHFAIIWGHNEIVKILLEHGAKTNIQNCLGETAFHSACLFKSIENRKINKQIIILLSTYQTNIPDGRTALDYGGRTAYQLALQNKYEADILKMLVPETPKPLWRSLAQSVSNLRTILSHSS